MHGDPGIALIGTLDTKGAEIAYVRDRLRALGARPLVVDSGILGEADGCTADVPRDEVARAAGRALEEIRGAGSRGAAVQLMLEGVRAVVLRRTRRGACTACCAWAAPRARCSAPRRCTRCPSACRS